MILTQVKGEIEQKRGSDGWSMILVSDSVSYHGVQTETSTSSILMLIVMRMWCMPITASTTRPLMLDAAGVEPF